MTPVVDAIQRFWAERALGVGPVVVGYSGGPDSTALLHGLSSLGLSVIAAHLHHGMRAEVADADVEHCRAAAERMGASFAVGYEDVRALATLTKVGVEEAGRKARYAFFERIRGESGAPYIATGHTLDDHVETVLMNVARGCGLQGLCGIPAVRGFIVRPILKVTRSQTAAYCEANCLATILDATNVEEDYRRNLLRRALQGIYGETIYASVPRLSEIAWAENDLMAEMVVGLVAELRAMQHPLWAEMGIPVREWSLPDAWLGGLSLGLQRRLLRLLCEDGLEFDGVQAALAGRGVTTKSGYRVFPAEGCLCVGLDTGTPPEGEWRLTPKGIELLDLACDLDYDEAPPPSNPRDYAGTRAVFDRELIRGDLTVRIPAAGTYRPLGFGASKEIRDLLSAARVPGWLRKRAPAVYDQDGPIWALGSRVAERVKVTEATRQCGYLRVISNERRYNGPALEVGA